MNDEEAWPADDPAPDLSNRGNESYQKFRVAVRACDNGQYMYHIFTLAGEPRTFQSDSGKYATPREAEQAGYEAVAVLTAQSQWQCPVRVSQTVRASQTNGALGNSDVPIRRHPLYLK
jgi:hypothetical protein